MLKVGCFSNSKELLVNGDRRDYENLASLTEELFNHPDSTETIVHVRSTGEVAVETLIVRKSDGLNQVFCEPGRVVFAVAPSFLRSFLSFISFPEEPSVGYHHHYDQLCGGGGIVSQDSLWVVFGLERA